MEPFYVLARDLRSTHSRERGAPARPYPVPHGAHASVKKNCVELICPRVLWTLVDPQPVSRMMGRATPRQRGAVPRAARDLRSTHSRVGGAPARPCPVPHGAHASSSSARVFAGHVELVSGHCCNDL